MSTEPARLVFRATYTDGSTKDFEVGKVTSIRKGGRAGVEMHLDLMQDGKHLLICSTNMLPDDKQLQSVVFVRFPPAVK